MRLHWHRRDLRLADNPGLVSGSTAEPVCGLFVIDEGIHKYASPPRIEFVLDALHSLREAYRERDADLLVRTGDPLDLVPAVADRLDADVVTAPADYSALAADRDGRVRERLAGGTDLDTIHDSVLVPPGRLTTTADEPYSVFSDYGKQWLDRDHPSPHESPDTEALAVPGGVDPEPIPTVAELGYEAPVPTVPDASPATAVDRLETFVDGPIYDYAEARDYPAREGTSRLSPHLRFGTIGVRTVYAATAEALAAAHEDPERESVREFQRQLAWRDFYAEQLANRPSVVARDLTEFESPIEWVNDEAAYEAWTAGETGYPIVDAGMRQLRQEGWLHNRVRMIVASFLTKDLRIDWRWGYEWFRETLIDHDPANGAGGWQRAASTGPDAQSIFRIVNPASQAETYDPEGEYVRSYVPELSEVPTEAIHDWPTLDAGRRCALAPGYPSPIVDHGEAREAALAMYRRARGETAGE